MAVIDWLTQQFQSPGMVMALLQLLAIVLLAVIPISLWRADRRRGYETRAREAAALAEIADYICDLTVAVSDAFTDEVIASEFVEAFERRQLEDGQMMLEAINPQSLPSLSLLRPLFELRTVLEDASLLVDRLSVIMDDPDREGWQDTRAAARKLAERAAIGADSFRSLAHDAAADGFSL